MSRVAHVRDRAAAREGGPVRTEGIENVVPSGFHTAVERPFLGRGRRSGCRQDEQQAQTEEASRTMHGISPLVKMNEVRNTFPLPCYLF